MSTREEIISGFYTHKEKHYNYLQINFIVLRRCLYGGIDGVGAKIWPDRQGGFDKQAAC